VCFKKGMTEHYMHECTNNVCPMPRCHFLPIIICSYSPPLGQPLLPLFSLELLPSAGRPPLPLLRSVGLYIWRSSGGLLVLLFFFMFLYIMATKHLISNGRANYASILLFCLLLVVELLDVCDCQALELIFCWGGWMCFCVF
jgi:hypothetical protein